MNQPPTNDTPTRGKKPLRIMIKDALGIPDYERQHAEATAAASEAKAAYETAMGLLALGEGSEEAVATAKAAFDAANLRAESATAAVAELHRRKDADAEKAKAATLDAQWARSARLAAQHTSLLRKLQMSAAECEAIHSELITVRMMLDQASPRRQSSAALRDLIHGETARRRLEQLFVYLTPTFHRHLIGSRGMKPHALGVDGLIADEIALSAPFGDRNWEGKN